MHIPVLLNEVIDYLDAAKGGTFFDGTLGLAGHSSAMLEAAPGNTLYATDKDTESLSVAKKKLEPFPGQFTLFHSDFRKIFDLPLDIETIDGLLFDLGVSSPQLDNPEKGFSYAREAPLDMRMDKSQELSAAHVVNDYSYDQLTSVLRQYGEFSNCTRIVQQVVYHRKVQRIETTEQLKTIIRRVAPKQKTMDPLSRLFQAVRIEVNGELAGLQEFFMALFSRMKPGARVAIISFHSLEDRIAKNALKKGKANGDIKILTKKPIIASEEEITTNPRARSAKLRVGEKLRVD
ncbi:MAG: 16S rRNA (cytosine(1402)-N(4))-methyltransferase RsmH [bacterium]|nr:16S rRNA (cytosine(1402)-N(4))-methyltransferase RsmH [bacterium]